MLAATVDNLFQIAAKLVIGRSLRSESFRDGNTLRDRAARSASGRDAGDRPVIVFDDHLVAVTHLFERRVNVARQLGFGHVDLRHTLMIPAFD